MLKMSITTGIFLVVFLNACAISEKKVHLEESNYSPSEETIWSPEQR